MIRTKWFKAKIDRSPSGKYRWAIMQGDTAFESGICPTKGAAIQQSHVAKERLARKFGVQLNETRNQS